MCPRQAQFVKEPLYTKGFVREGIHPDLSIFSTEFDVKISNEGNIMLEIQLHKLYNDFIIFSDFFRIFMNSDAGGRTGKSSVSRGHHQQ